MKPDLRVRIENLIETALAAYDRWPVAAIAKRDHALTVYC
jgi:hypothetical protein